MDNKKEIEIEKMKKIVQDNACENLAEGYINTVDDDILALYNAGYRKASEVRKEMAKEFIALIRWKDWYLANQIAKKYGVKIDE